MYFENYEQKRKKANKIGISVRISTEQKEKLGMIRDYLRNNMGELPKGVYYRWSRSEITDGDIIRFLIENFEIPKNTDK